MLIAGLVKNSFVDYPEKIAIVVFAPGCNYDCFYCHNRQVIDKKVGTIKEEEVFDLLKKRIGLIDGVVISGGEATMQKDLIPFIEKIKKMGYAVKLDSNGSNPQVIEELLAKKLIDYFAIDYKAPQYKYKEICGSCVNSEKVLKTINILKGSGVAFEVRTTVIPTLTEKDFMIMVEELGEIPKYILNPYRMPENYKIEDKKRLQGKVIDIELLKLYQPVA